MEGPAFLPMLLPASFGKSLRKTLDPCSLMAHSMAERWTHSTRMAQRLGSFASEAKQKIH